MQTLINIFLQLPKYIYFTMEEFGGGPRPKKSEVDRSVERGAVFLYMTLNNFYKTCKICWHLQFMHIYLKTSLIIICLVRQNPGTAKCHHYPMIQSELQYTTSQKKQAIAYRLTRIFFFLLHLHVLLLYCTRARFFFLQLHFIKNMFVNVFILQCKLLIIFYYEQRTNKDIQQLLYSLL